MLRSLKHFFAYPFLLSLVLFSCSAHKDKIVGTWHVVKWENPTADSFFTNSRNYIDTMGKGHSDAENIALYGVANMDSVREAMQKNFDSAKGAEESAELKTVFTFKKDGEVEVMLNGTTNTGTWLMDKDGALIIEEKGFAHPDAISKYQLVSLNDEQLVLKFYDENVSNTVTFEREGK